MGHWGQCWLSGRCLQYNRPGFDCESLLIAKCELVLSTIYAMVKYMYMWAIGGSAGSVAGVYNTIGQVLIAREFNNCKMRAGFEHDIRNG